MTDPTTAAYAARAAEYTDLLGSVSAMHPSDRQLIESWAEGIRGAVLDAGCGPGHWTTHLAERGLSVRGIDLVPWFVAHARGAYPGVRFDLGSIDAIEAADGSFAGVLSWFSTIHHEPEAIGVPLAEFARVLEPGGRLALGVFVGDALEPFDHAVVRAYRWPVDELERRLDAAGFDIVETHTRTARGQRPVGAIIAERWRPPAPSD